MSASNILEEKARTQKKNLGNPIMDVFYEASERFGEYWNNDLPRSIDLYHFTSMDFNRVKTYAKELSTTDHFHHQVKELKATELFKHFIQITCDDLLQIIQTRIPIQICTIVDGNLEPLNAGKR